MLCSVSIIQAIILGAIQGLSEFLPISSSGHLVVVPELFGIPKPSLAFDVLLHLATVAAAVA
jgi:undecaprenyl-diphosphatase